MTDTLDALVERMRAICNSYAGNYDIRRDAGQAADSIAALRGELEELKCNVLPIMANERDALRAEVEALRKELEWVQAHSRAALMHDPKLPRAARKEREKALCAINAVTMGFWKP